MREFVIAGVVFVPPTGEMKYLGREARIEPKAAAVLEALCRNSGQLVTRDNLLDSCWSVGEGSDEALTQAIRQIRKAFASLGRPDDPIRTYPKRGYKLSPKEEAAGRAVADRVRRPSRRLAWSVGIVAVATVAITLIGAADEHALRHLLVHHLPFLSIGALGH